MPMFRQNNRQHTIGTFFLRDFSIMSHNQRYFCRLLTKSKSDTEFYDPAEIHNRNHLKSYMKEALVKLGYNLLAFFVYLYW